MLDQELFIEQLLRAGAEVSLQNANGESAFLSGNKRQQNFIAKICKQGTTESFSELTKLTVSFRKQNDHSRPCRTLRIR